MSKLRYIRLYETGAGTDGKWKESHSCLGDISPATQAVIKTGKVMSRQEKSYFARIRLNVVVREGIFVYIGELG